MISLVTTTNKRSLEFEEFCQSLSHYDKIQLIVIDQNETDTYVSNCLHSLREKGLEIVHIKKTGLSLSAARNLGLHYVKYRVLGFPDDDCIYAGNVIEQLLAIIQKESEGGYIVGFSDTDRKEDLFKSEAAICQMKDRYSLFGNLISYTFFLVMNAPLNISFDENLGVGTYFSSAEETDFAFRFLKSVQGQLVYVSNVYVFHPNKVSAFNYSRESSYGRGLGAFVKKNFEWNLPFINRYYLLPLIIKPIVAFFLALFTFNRTGCKIALTKLVYRNRGFIQFKND